MPRAPSDSVPGWLRSILAFALFALPLATSCTSSEDTEPFVPASEGAVQPKATGALLSEAAACERLADAQSTALDRLGCAAPDLAACPGYIRPGGGSGCYEYSAGSVEACEAGYAAASSCAKLAPCVVTAVENRSLTTCAVASGAGGAGGADTGVAGASSVGGVGAGGAEPLGNVAGDTGVGGATGGQLSSGVGGA